MGYLEFMKAGKPRISEVLVAGAASKMSVNVFDGGRVLRLISDAAGTAIRVANEFLTNPGFENPNTFKLDGTIEPNTRGWFVLEDGATFRKNTAAPLKELVDLKLTGSSNGVPNGSLDAWSAGAPVSWTESGAGAITEEVTIVVLGSSAKFVTGVGQTAKLTSTAIPVAALIPLNIRVSLRGDGAAGAVVRVIDNASGEYLQTNGTWAAGPTTLFTRTAATFAAFNLHFLARTGATTITIEIELVTASATAYADEVSVAKDNSGLFTTSMYELPALRAMALLINYKGSVVAGGNSFRYSLQDTVAGKWLQSGGSWTTAEFFFEVIAANDVAAENAKTFTSNGVGRYQLVVKPGTLTSLESFQFDNFKLSEVAIAGDPLFIGNAPEYVYLTKQSRVSVLNAAGANVSIAEMTI